jgi:hypothetical protein
MLLLKSHKNLMNNLSEIFPDIQPIHERNASLQTIIDNEDQGSIETVYKQLNYGLTNTVIDRIYAKDYDFVLQNMGDEEEEEEQEQQQQEQEQEQEQEQQQQQQEQEQEQEQEQKQNPNKKIGILFYTFAGTILPRMVNEEKEVFWSMIQTQLQFIVLIKQMGSTAGKFETIAKKCISKRQQEGNNNNNDQKGFNFGSIAEVLKDKDITDNVVDLFSEPDLIPELIGNMGNMFRGMGLMQETEVSEEEGEEESEDGKEEDEEEKSGNMDNSIISNPASEIMQNRSKRNRARRKQQKKNSTNPIVGLTKLIEDIDIKTEDMEEVRDFVKGGFDHEKIANLFAGVAKNCSESTENEEGNAPADVLKSTMANMVSEMMKAENHDEEKKAEVEEKLNEIHETFGPIMNQFMTSFGQQQQKK